MNIHTFLFPRGKHLAAKNGFTLIELLVVISTIGLLASVVLVSVNNARIKSDNSVRSSIVEQYKNAFDLYYFNNGEYPVPTDIIATYGQLVTCLGSYAGNVCYDLSGTIHESPVLNSAIAPYLNSRQSLKPTNTGILAQPYNDGPTYTCANPGCLVPSIGWFLGGKDQVCGYGIPPAGTFGNTIGSASNVSQPAGWSTLCYLKLL